MVFLDEASSALDSETEAAMYLLLTEELPDAAIISIAHREKVAQYHDERWQFVPDAGERDALNDGPRYRIAFSGIGTPVEAASQLSASRTQ
jgi:putative ATP-binding cassette transporter